MLMPEENSTKTFLDLFGFVTNQAKRNLVIFFFVLLIFSNAFFIWRTLEQEKKIEKLNIEKLEISQTLSKQITEEVRKQIQPAAERVIKAADRVNDAALSLDSANKTKNLNQ